MATIVKPGQRELFNALDDFIKAVAISKHVRKADAEMHLKDLKAVITNNSSSNVWQTEGPRMAIKLWTSDLKGAFNKEFCSLLNEVIRTDDSNDAFIAAVKIVRLMNLLIISNRGGASQVRWPENWKTFRGTGLPMEEVRSFVKGKQYRAAMFLATTVDKKVTEHFLDQISDNLVPVLFTFEIDQDHKCLHAMYLEDHTLVKGEREFLYTPYSTFTVENVYIPEKIDSSNPVQIALSVAPDNLIALEDLPTKVWH
jgi:hypothetical protein